MSKTTIISVLLVLALATTAWGHPKVVLKDYAGTSVLLSYLPVNYRSSCQDCHDIDSINMGYHFQMGRLAILPSATYDKYRQRYGSQLLSNGLPVNQALLSTPWFADNPSYGPGGMYGRTAMNHTQKLAPYETDDPLHVGLTTPDQVNGKCSACHPGGGFNTEDRMGNKLTEMSQQKIQAALDAGRYLGDYLRSDKKTGALTPYTWTKKVGDQDIPNLQEIDCMICHAADYDLGQTRKYLKKGLAAWAATAGARLGTIRADLRIDYDPQRVKNIDTSIAPTSNETCGRCHATAYDIDGDNRITLHDNHSFAAEPALKNSPGLKKRAQTIGYGIARINGVQQRVAALDKPVKYYDVEKKSWQPVPYLDVHLQAGMSCNDCHQPVPHRPLSGTIDKNYDRRYPSHDLAKGSAGYNVRSDLSGSARCENCHESYLDDHQGTFGPARVTATHMQKIHCSTCHIPRKFGILGESVMKDRSNDNKPDSFKNTIELDGLGKVGVPTAPDYVYYPDWNPVSGVYTLKIKPANAMSEMYWATDAGGPVPNRILGLSFCIDPNTFSLDPSTPGPQSLFKLRYYKNGKPAKMKNGLKINSESLAVYADAEKISIPATLAKEMGVPAAAPLVGRLSKKGVRYDLKRGKTGWVVIKTGANQIVQPLSKKTMIVRADDKQWTIIDKQDEIRFAARALQENFRKLYQKEVVIKYVYHLTSYDGSFIMSHNVAPIHDTKSGASLASDPQRVLQCRDCHRTDGVFNRSIKVGVNIEQVAGITAFEMPQTALRDNQGDFSEADLRAATYAYYSPAMISMLPVDGRVLVRHVWTENAGASALPVHETNLIPEKFKQNNLEVIRISLLEAQGRIRLRAVDPALRTFKVRTWPTDVITSKRSLTTGIELDLKNPGQDIILMISR